MFFDNMDEEVFLDNPNLYQIVSRELFGLRANINRESIVRDVPTHTEDGIPIRKLYVSNLPPKTTRTELFGLFAQYGFIKSCWLRMGERGPSKSPTPTYAFVTYSNPSDAHKALLAPPLERYLRGRQLRISPADSWHQPIQSPDGRVRWKARCNNYVAPAAELGESSAGAGNTEDVANTEHEDVDIADATYTTDTETIAEEALVPQEQSFGILEILNRDCLNHILRFIPVLDLVRTERTSKQWQAIVQEHLESRRTFRTSWWDLTRRTLTTAVFRRVLQRLGGALTRLHIDHQLTVTSLNDRTAHIVGKFCPNLEELKVFGMYTKNWNPLIYGCKELKSVKFVSCNKLTDSSMVQLVKNDSNIESLIIANNTHVTGLFLTGSRPPKLNALSLYNCSSLQGTVLYAALDTLPHITTLRLDMCPGTIWKYVPRIMNKLPRLEVLSLTEYTSVECIHTQTKDFCEALGKLHHLKVLNLSKNIYVNSSVLKIVANSCPNLETLNVSSCNARRNYPGVNDENLEQVCGACKQLSWVDVSYLGAVSDRGLAALAGLPALRTLISRGNRQLTARPFVACLSACPQLREVDASGCNGVSSEVVCAAVLALDEAPRLLALHLANTLAVNNKKNIPHHKCLMVNMEEDYCNPHLRPDFMDQIFDDSSDDDSFDDVLYDGFFGEVSEDDDDIFMDDDDFEDYDGLVFGLHRDIILL